MQALDQLQSLDDLRSELKARHLVPGWEKQSRPLFIPEMRSEYDPGHWRYAQVHAAMLSAGRLIDTELAERRNTIMVNPRAGHDVETLNTLICAYQSILPGEKVLLVDDLLATGGTAEAGIKLIERLGAQVVGCAFVVDLPDLGGRRKLEAMGMDVHALCAFDGL